MGAANFYTMDKFPLIVANSEYCRICPECGCICPDKAAECTECGVDISDIESTIDESNEELQYLQMEAVAERINGKARFFKVAVYHGYYSGLQFYVDYSGDDYNPHTAKNSECWYDYGMSKAAAIRKHDKELNRIVWELRNARKELGLVELQVVARYSNGDTFYAPKKDKSKATDNKKVA